MSQWEYVVKEAQLFHWESDPEEFSIGGSTLPEEKQRLKDTFNDGMISELSEFGKDLQHYLDEMGEAGWEVYQIERLEKHVDTKHAALDNQESFEHKINKQYHDLKMEFNKHQESVINKIEIRLKKID